MKDIIGWRFLLLLSIVLIPTGCYRQASNDNAPLVIPASQTAQEPEIIEITNTPKETDPNILLTNNTQDQTSTHSRVSDTDRAISTAPGKLNGGSRETANLSTYTRTPSDIKPLSSPTENLVRTTINPVSPTRQALSTATEIDLTLIPPSTQHGPTAHPETVFQASTDPPSPASDGFQAIPDNTKWTPQSRILQGVEMVLVPVGCFTMGNDNVPEESPAHEQCFNRPFWIDRYEVTNALFGSVGMTTHPGKPRDTISWFGAVQHCQSRAARLPTEVEWEYAARGPSSLIYPWGDKFESSYVVYDGETVEIVGSLPAGVSWVGAFDMSGNVWEWTSTNFSAYPYTADGSLDKITYDDSQRVIRGGSVINLGDTMRSSARSAPETAHASPYIGFRCAKDFAFP